MLMSLKEKHKINENAGQLRSEMETAKGNWKF
jgi:hypothetical protein